VVTQTEKKLTIERLVNVPATQRRHFWGREVKSLNELLKSYPERKFWLGVKFPTKVETMIVFRSGYYSRELKKKHNRFKYSIPLKGEVSLGEKSGPDYNPNDEPLTLKKFLS
jgi:hypothetical protein